MPRRTRAAQTQRSEHWLRVAVNECTHFFNAQVQGELHLDSADPIEWLSPVMSDGYAEYYDEAFLERLQIEGLRTPLNKFWPQSGPRWDGLARTRSGKVILVEAKAYAEESVDFRSKATDVSLRQIRAALCAAKSAFKASTAANWEEPFYQYANRLAHLYFLRELNRIDAYLLFVCFADAPDVPSPTNREEWCGALRIIERALGLGAHPFREFVGHLVLSVPKMLANGRSPGDVQSREKTAPAGSATFCPP